MSETTKLEEYLGDGLYARADGHMITLYADRDETRHWVGLEPGVLEAFLRFVEARRPAATGARQ